MRALSLTEEDVHPPGLDPTPEKLDLHAARQPVALTPAQQDALPRQPPEHARRRRSLPEPEEPAHGPRLDRHDRHSFRRYEARLP